MTDIALRATVTALQHPVASLVGLVALIALAVAGGSWANDRDIERAQREVESETVKGNAR